MSVEELRGGQGAVAVPDATAATADVVVVEKRAIRAANHEAAVVVASATRQAEG